MLMVFCQNNWATWVYFGKYDDNPYCGASIQYKVDGVCQTNEDIWDLLDNYDNNSPYYTKPQPCGFSIP